MEALTRKLLANRGLVNDEEVDRFLNPRYDTHLHNPFLLCDMDKAVERILRAVRDKEKIILYTDYDTDGIPAGVLLHDFFREIGHVAFENYIPHRNDEGYGLNNGAIERFKKGGATLIITADCGITDNEEVNYAKTLGIDVVVTDHHLPRKNESGGDVLPPAYAVVNPHREDDAYPFRELCGAGVAFKLVQALLERGREEGLITLREGREKWLLDMVAIATISDRVPLVGENRVLVYYGLKVLRKSPRWGIKKLFQKAYTSQSELTEEDVGFVIGPRINVASRIDTPQKAFRLLATSDPREAEQLALEINGLNEKRKGLVAGIIKEARKKIGKGDISCVLVVGSTDWFPGILGLAAQNLVEEYRRPVFLWGRGGGDDLKGSCRSDGSVNIVELMDGAKDVLNDFGGHENSGGFSISPSKLHLLEEKLAECHARIKKEIAQKEHFVDEEIILDGVTWDMFNGIQKLAPFGEGNPRPVFLFKDIIVSRTEFFGKERRHTKLIFNNTRDESIAAIKFFSNSETTSTCGSTGENINLKAYVEQNIFKGSRELRLRIVDIQAAR